MVNFRIKFIIGRIILVVMKKLEAVVLILVLAAALAGMYFAFKGFGMAIKHVDVPIVISGGAIEPSEFTVVKDESYVSVANVDNKNYEVEIVKVGKKSDKIVWRRDVYAGETATPFKLNSGNYAATIIG